VSGGGCRDPGRWKRSPALESINSARPHLLHKPSLFRLSPRKIGTSLSSPSKQHTPLPPPNLLRKGTLPNFSSYFVFFLETPLPATGVCDSFHLTHFRFGNRSEKLVLSYLCLFYVDSLEPLACVSILFITYPGKSCLKIPFHFEPHFQCNSQVYL
jgi:hypothetical protein